MFNDLRPAWIIARRELKDQFRDWRIIIPLVLLALVFPGLVDFAAGQLVDFMRGYGANIFADRLIPFMLMVVGFFPVSISLAIALESFVGEKERGSIEPLLTSPLTDVQIYVGKLAAALVPPLMASILAVIVYLVGINLQLGWRPPGILLVQILLLTLVQGIVMVSGAVIISSQTTSVKAANLLAAFVIIPMAFLIQGEAVVMFWARYYVLWWVIAGQAVIAALLIRSGISYFNREELLGRELDSLNFRWGWRVFVETFSGGERNLLDWYRRVVGPAVRRMLAPVLGMFLALVRGMWAGAGEASEFALPVKTLNLSNLDQGFINGLDAIRFFSVSGVGTVWMHNLRAILLATLAGFFSFGVLGVLVLMIPLMLVGYFMANAAAAGLSPMVFLGALVAPHGIFEIPAIVLAGAAIMHLGGTLLAPSHGQSIGEAWLRSLADWAKIVLGLVVPLLLAAAFVEVLLTPRVAVWLLGG
jgi:ABC-type transport system involved in multi-copper enzyme maturation permease subunit